MSQPTRKRDKLAKLFGGNSRQNVSARSMDAAVTVPSVSAPVPPASNVASHRLEILSSMRTVFDLLDSVLDGCPIWGPKAAASAVAKGIKAVQTDIENEESVEDVVEAVHKTVDLLAPAMPPLPSSVSPELRSRISAHISELETIREGTVKWRTEQRNFGRRVLDAERVAKELEGLMSKIHAANERFLMETATRTEVKVEVIDRNVMGIQERDLLDRLRPVKEAFHDAPNASEMCLAGTREQLLADLSAWFGDLDPSRERVFWLNGLAGTGKTTVARTMAARARDQGRLGATFFFSRDVAAARDPAAILPTVAYQLAHYQSSFCASMCTSLSSDKDVRDRGIVAQARVLFDNLSRVNLPKMPLLIVLDALDECHLENGCEGGDAVPLLLAKFASLPSVKILITSRPEDTIKHMFKSINSRLALHNIEADIVQSDILHYLKHTLGEHARIRELTPPFPTDDELDELVKRAGTLFIYAATVVKWVSDPKAKPNLRLQQILDQDVDEVAFQHKMLDGMYSQILAQAAQTSGNPKPHERALGHILSAVVLLQEPLHEAALASLAGEDKRAGAVLPLLSAVLLVDDAAPVRLFHPSFSDFITDPERCMGQRFLVTRSEGHLRLAIRCLEIMNVGLREDICDIQDPSLANSEVTDLEQRLDRVAPSELRYACNYWHVHLRLAAFTSPGLIEQLETFCTLHLPHWIELLSLLGNFASLTGFDSTEPWLTYVEGCEALQGSSVPTLLHDVTRLILAYSVSIKSHALHVYHSALATMPSCLLLRNMGQHCAGLPLLISARSSDWGARTQTFPGCASGVRPLALSVDGRLVVSSLEDQTIRVWNVPTGAERTVIRGHNSLVHSIAFSPDGHLIVTGSKDSMVHVWDVSTGLQQHAMNGHNDEVNMVKFSPDGRLIVSGSDDGTLQTWDTVTGARGCVMHGHKNLVWAVAFSPDCRYVVSGSGDSSVRVWDVMTGIQQHVMKGHGCLVLSVAFSPDGQRIVSGSGDRTVRLWDAITGLQRHVMEGHTDNVLSAFFLPNGRSIVSSSYDGTVRLWDAATGAQRHIFKNPGFVALSFALPSDGRVIACGLVQRSIQVWHIVDGAELGDQHNALPGHEDYVQSVAFSSDGQHVVTGSDDCTVQMWDATTGLQVRVMNGHEDAVQAATFSPNGQWIASGSEDRTIRMWDAQTGAHVHTMNDHKGSVNAVSFSPDSQLIVSASGDHTVRVWDAITGHCRHVLNGHSRVVYRVVYSSDGRYIASGSWDDTIRIWDATSYTQQHVMCGHTDDVESIAFSSDGRLLVSGSDDHTVRVWDVATGAQHHVMEGHTDTVRSVGFLYDNKSIVSRSLDGTTRIWKTATGKPLRVPWQQQETQARADQHPAVTHPLFNIDNDGWISRLNMEGAWQRVCWIPPDRRSDLNAWQSSGQRVCVGASSGVITIMDFSHVA